MNFTQAFLPLEANDILKQAQACKDEGWRFVQILAVNTEQGIDLIYSFMAPYSSNASNAELVNYKFVGVTKDDTIPSITGLYLEAFVFENEIHDLFGVNITDIAIDFHGAFYALKQNEPMTIISPAQLEAREKARKIAAAKATKAAKAAKNAQAVKAGEGDDKAPTEKVDAVPSPKAEGKGE